MPLPLPLPLPPPLPPTPLPLPLQLPLPLPLPLPFNSDPLPAPRGSQEGSHHGRSHAGHRGSPTASGGAAHSSASTVASVSNAETTDGADGAGGKALGGREGAKVGAGDEVSGSSLTGRLLASLPHFPRMRLDVSEHQARFKADSLMVAVFWTTMLTATSVANLEFPNMHRHLKNTLGLTVMLGILGSVEAIASFLAKLLTGEECMASCMHGATAPVGQCLLVICGSRSMFAVPRLHSLSLPTQPPQASTAWIRSTTPTSPSPFLTSGSGGIDSRVCCSKTSRSIPSSRGPWSRNDQARIYR